MSTCVHQSSLFTDGRFVVINHHHAQYLQKVVRSSWTLMPGFISWRWIELRKLAMIIDGIFARLFNTVIHFHNGSLVSASVTIIGSRKDRHHCSIVLPLVAFHHQLVRTGNKVQTINVRELLRNVLAKCVTRSPRGNSPTATVVMRAKQFVSTILFSFRSL